MGTVADHTGSKMKIFWIRTGFAVAAMTVAIAFYIYGFLNEPRLRDGDSQQRAYARQVSTRH